ncbi:MAG: response regulator [Anaerolineae bacterium]|nr:response regulator [Anaerolineae bacterium]
MGDVSETKSNGHKKNGAADPAAKDAAEKQPAAEEKIETRPDPTHTVLIVEDTEELAEIIQVTLERLNLKVFHETHGDKALTIYETEKPDLIILDIALPDTNGWKVLDTIREQQRGGETPMIIIITAYGDPANRLMGKLQGIESYLIKPFSPGDIEKIVAQALNLSQK